jgi:RimJ/RimL family protein N-acetyltransferase
MPIQFPSVSTPRLKLRPFGASDLDALDAIHGDPQVMRFLGVGAGAGKTRTRPENWDFMQRVLGQWALRGYGVWAVELTATGALIGRAGLLHPFEWPSAEIAYTFARAAWGQGLATEAVLAIRDWAFAHLPDPHFVSFISPDNAASRRLAARVGAVQEDRIDLLGTPADRWVHYRPGRGPIV